MNIKGNEQASGLISPSSGKAVNLALDVFMCMVRDFSFERFHLRSVHVFVGFTDL